METLVPEELGDRIRQQREAKGWDQPELARRINTLIGRQPGYGKAAISKWEKGHTAMPPGDAIWAMCQLFGMPHDILLWGVDRRPPTLRRKPPGRGKLSA